MKTDDSYEHRQCAFFGYDRDHLPCWGPILTTEILHFEEGDFLVNTCSGHRYMLRGGPYAVEDTSKEFD